MEMFTLPLSLVALLATLWITSFFARLMSAKKYGMLWIFIAWVIGAFLSIATIISLDLLSLKPSTRLLLTYVLPLLIFTFVYRVINKMDWITAMTINITSLAMGVIATVIVIITLGKPLDNTLITLANYVGLVKASPLHQVSDAFNDEEEEGDDVVFSDQDLLRPQVISAIKQQQRQQQKSYIEPKFTVIMLHQAKHAIGHTIRIAKKNGTVLEGVLQQITHGQFVLQQTRNGGIATLPIEKTSVKTVAVYR